MYVYVVRWSQMVDGETSCGNFEVCYANEEAARRQMLQDLENTVKDWTKGADPEKFSTMFSPDGDYCHLEMKDGSYDIHEWWIDKLELGN